MIACDSNITSNKELKAKAKNTNKRILKRKTVLNAGAGIEQHVKGDEVMFRRRMSMQAFRIKVVEITGAHQTGLPGEVNQRASYNVFGLPSDAVYMTCFPTAALLPCQTTSGPV